MMRMLMVAAVLLASPYAAFAGCSGDHAAQQAMSCAEGTMWDPQTRSCTKVTG